MINAITPKIVILPYIELIQRVEVTKIAVGPSAPPIIPTDGVGGIKSKDIQGVTIQLIISNAPIIIDIIEIFFIKSLPKIKYIILKNKCKKNIYL